MVVSRGEDFIAGLERESVVDEGKALRRAVRQRHLIRSPAKIIRCSALHPRWKTPHVALYVQAAFAFVFVFIGQAGTSVRGAYEALVSMAVISYFIPFLYMFAALARLQREPARPGVLRVPGGPIVAKVLATLGFLVTLAAIVLACVPADDDPNKTLTVVKIVGGSVVLVATGAIVYVLGKRRS